MSETKHLHTALEIKAVDTGQRLVEGWAAAIGNKDRVGDVIDAGAFDRTLKENADVLVFIGHDASRLPVGEPSQMRPEAKGLFTSTRIYNTPAGNELLEVAKERLQSGKTLGMSIGYRAVRSKNSGGARHLLDVDLLEYSFLASPALAANPEAIMTGVKRRRKANSVGPVITTEDSYEDLRDDLQDAAAVLLERGYVNVCATFSDHVIVSGFDGDDTDFWDIPYTLDADGEPVLGEPSELDPAFVPASAKALAMESKPYRVERRNGKYCVVGGSSGDRTFGCHATRAEALAQQRALYANEGKALPMLNDLPDRAFAFIEAGGTLDEEHKTVPRSARHFAHHHEDGSLDTDALEEALANPELRKGGPNVVAHLLLHDSKRKADAHAVEWKDGVAPELLSLAYLIMDAAFHAASDRKAMEHLEVDTKFGQVVKPNRLVEIERLYATFGEIINQIKAVARNEDASARAELYRMAFDLIDLEEVA